MFGIIIYIFVNEQVSLKYIEYEGIQIIQYCSLDKKSLLKLLSNYI